MTPHRYYKQLCQHCEARTLLYDRDVPCPRCGLIEQEGFDFILRAAASARYNFKVYGSYVSPFWDTDSFDKYILGLSFALLEKYRMAPSGLSFSDTAREILAQMDWGEQHYLCDYVHTIAVKVYEELNNS